MRIFGGHDYYDGVQGALGVSSDDPIRFIRTAKVITQDTIRNASSRHYKQKTEWLPFELHFISHLSMYGDINYHYRNINIRPFEIFFCGRYYVGYRVGEFLTYSFEKLCNHLRTLDVSEEYIQKKMLPTPRKMGYPDIFSFLYTKQTQEWMIKNKIAVATNDSYRSPDYSNQVVLNGYDLGRYQFQQIMDPFTAYQKLEAYISNDLAGPMDGPDITDDKIKIQKHGFDLKTSFRHPVKV